MNEEKLKIKKSQQILARILVLVAIQKKSATVEISMSQGGEKRPITKPSQITPDYLPKGLQVSIQQESALSLMFTAALCRILNLASFLNILNNR